MFFRTLFLLAAPVLAVTNFSALTPHTWTAAPSPTMENTPGVIPSPVSPPGGNGFREVWASWGSGAWDNDSSWLYVFGGGHASYSGNEIYIFDVRTETWRRIFGPTDATTINNSIGVETSGYYGQVGNTSVPDSGAPRSRHDYNTLHVVNGKFISWACIFDYPGALSAANTDEFDPVTKTWTHRDYTEGNFGYDNVADVDSATGKLWVYIGGSGGYLTDYDGVTHTWTAHGNIFQGNPMGGNEVTGAIVPSLHRLYAFGLGIAGYWDLNGSFPVDFHPVTTSGPQTIVNAYAPGVQWDPVAQRIVGWASGDSVFTYQPSDSTWTGVAVAGSNAAHPTAPQGSGTYGRWRYMPSKNAYILSNASTDSVYYYKLTADPAPLSRPGRVTLLGAGPN
jgi:hypothetical protein